LDNIELRVPGLSKNLGIGNDEPNISNNAGHLRLDRVSREDDRQYRDQDITTGGGRDDGPLENFTQRVETRINKMEGKLHALLAKSNERAIRFSGLGFQSIADSNAFFGD
jgi:hypothetical protein